MLVQELIERLSSLSDVEKNLPVTYVNIGAGWADGRIVINNVSIVELDILYQEDVDYVGFKKAAELG